MIEKTYHSKKPLHTPPVVIPQATYYSAYDTFLARQMGIEVAEFVRRKNILAKVANDCAFMTGDTAYPASKEEYEQFGAVIILSVARTMKDLGTEYEWPQTDNPMIVTFRPVKSNEHMWCTTNYLTKRNFHLETC